MRYDYIKKNVNIKRIAAWCKTPNAQVQAGLLCCRRAVLLLEKDKAVSGEQVLLHFHAYQRLCQAAGQAAGSSLLTALWDGTKHHIASWTECSPSLFSTLPPLTASLSQKIKTSVWQNRREIQGHKHVIHNPENPFSELEAPKGWILQGSLLRVLDVAKNKADRAEKPLGFSINCWTTEPSTAEDGSPEHFQTHLDFTGAPAASPPHLCPTAAALLSTAAKARAALPWPPQTKSHFSGRII